MRIRVLLIGEDPLTLLTDGQLLKDRGIVVYTAFYLDNIKDVIDEVKPDIVFFNPQNPHSNIADVYNDFVSGIYHTGIPVIYTLAEDDVYLVTRKRTASKEKRAIIADNIIDAVKMALTTGRTNTRKLLHLPPNINNRGFNARA